MITIQNRFPNFFIDGSFRRKKRPDVAFKNPAAVQVINIRKNFSGHDAQETFAIVAGICSFYAREPAANFVEVNLHGFAHLQRIIYGENSFDVPNLTFDFLVANKKIFYLFQSVTALGICKQNEFDFLVANRF